MPFLGQKPKAPPNPRPFWFHHPVLWTLAFPHPPGLHTSLLQAPSMVRKQDSFTPGFWGRVCIQPVQLPLHSPLWGFPGSFLAHSPDGYTRGLSARCDCVPLLSCLPAPMMSLFSWSPEYLSESHLLPDPNPIVFSCPGHDDSLSVFEQTRLLPVSEIPQCCSL